MTTNLIFSDRRSLCTYFAKTSRDYQDQGTAFLSSSELQKLLDIQINPELCASLMHPDGSKPYGRQVIYQDDLIEIMVATWTPKNMCAPHDHGGSWSAIRILQGTSKHQLYRITNQTLHCVHTEFCPTSSSIQCTPNQIHAMGDAGIDQTPLMTIHAYSKSIPYMMVYDIANNQTIQVHGTCGAWIPEDTSQIVHVFQQSIPASDLHI